jgi:hypothetical protein
VLEWLESNSVERVTEPVFAELIRAFPEIRQRTLRQAVRESSVKIDAMVEGVRQESLPELARTLTALQAEYVAAHDDGARRHRIRSLVIESKTHAQFAARRKPEKQEMVQWMLVWLENPSLFDTWAKLRLRSIVESETGGAADPHAAEAGQD